MGAPYGSQTLTELIAVKIDPALKTQLVQQAEEHQLSLSAVARLAMRAGLAGLAMQQLPTQIEVHHG